MDERFDDELQFRSRLARRISSFDAVFRSTFVNTVILLQVNEKLAYNSVRKIFTINIIFKVGLPQVIQAMKLQEPEALRLPDMKVVYFIFIKVYT